MGKEYKTQADLIQRLAEQVLELEGRLQTAERKLSQLNHPSSCVDLSDAISNVAKAAQTGLQRLRDSLEADRADRVSVLSETDFGVDVEFENSVLRDAGLLDGGADTDGRNLDLENSDV